MSASAIDESNGTTVFEEDAFIVYIFLELHDVWFVSINGFTYLVFDGVPDIANGVDINLQNEKGNTPLHESISKIDHKIDFVN